MKMDVHVRQRVLPNFSVVGTIGGHREIIGRQHISICADIGLSVLYTGLQDLIHDRYIVDISAALLQQLCHL